MIRRIAVEFGLILSTTTVSSRSRQNFARVHRLSFRQYVVKMRVTEDYWPFRRYCIQGFRWKNPRKCSFVSCKSRPSTKRHAIAHNEKDSLFTVAGRERYRNVAHAAIYSVVLLSPCELHFVVCCQRTPLSISLLFGVLTMRLLFGYVVVLEVARIEQLNTAGCTYFSLLIEESRVVKHEFGNYCNHDVSRRFHRRSQGRPNCPQKGFRWVEEWA